MSKKLELVTRCCDDQVTGDEIIEMCEKGREITYRTFAKHVNVEALAKNMGYAYGRQEQGLRLSADYAVHFFRSVIRGLPCYYMDWSRIEHIFMCKEDAIRAQLAV